MLEILRGTGIEPTVIDYLKTPPDRATLQRLIAQMGVPVREVLRAKEALASELGLLDAARSDDELLDAMAAHPILINRPIVVSPKGTRLCRPSERGARAAALRPPPRRRGVSRPRACRSR